MSLVQARCGLCAQFFRKARATVWRRAQETANRDTACDSCWTAYVVPELAPKRRRVPVAAAGGTPAAGPAESGDHDADMGGGSDGGEDDGAGEAGAWEDGSDGSGGELSDGFSGSEPSGPEPDAGWRSERDGSSDGDECGLSSDDEEAGTSGRDADSGDEEGATGGGSGDGNVGADGWPKNGIWPAPWKLRGEYKPWRNAPFTIYELSASLLALQDDLKLGEADFNGILLFMCQTSESQPNYRPPTLDAIKSILGVTDHTSCLRHVCCGPEGGSPTPGCGVFPFRLPKDWSADERCPGCMELRFNKVTNVSNGRVTLVAKHSMYYFGVRNTITKMFNNVRFCRARSMFDRLRDIGGVWDAKYFKEVDATLRALGRSGLYSEYGLQQGGGGSGAGAGAAGGAGLGAGAAGAAAGGGRLEQGGGGGSGAASGASAGGAGQGAGAGAAGGAGLGADAAGAAAGGGGGLGGGAVAGGAGLDMGNGCCGPPNRGPPHRWDSSAIEITFDGVQAHRNSSQTVLIGGIRSVDVPSAERGRLENSYPLFILVGNEKPPQAHMWCFFTEFHEELDELEATGMTVTDAFLGDTFTLRVLLLLASGDTPMATMYMNCKGHTALQLCWRCFFQGRSGVHLGLRGGVYAQGYVQPAEQGEHAASWAVGSEGELVRTPLPAASILAKDAQPTTDKLLRLMGDTAAALAVPSRSSDALRAQAAALLPVLGLSLFERRPLMDLRWAILVPVCHTFLAGIVRTWLKHILPSQLGKAETRPLFVLNTAQRARLASRCALVVATSDVSGGSDNLIHHCTMKMESILFMTATAGHFIFHKMWTHNNTDPYYRMVLALSNLAHITFSTASELTPELEARFLAEATIFAELAEAHFPASMCPFNLHTFVMHCLESVPWTGRLGALNELWTERLVRLIVQMTRRGAISSHLGAVLTNIYLRRTRVASLRTMVDELGLTLEAMRFKRSTAKASHSATAAAIPAAAVPAATTQASAAAVTAAAPPAATSVPIASVVDADMPVPSGNYFSSKGRLLYLGTEKGIAFVNDMCAYFTAVRAHGIHPGHGFPGKRNMVVYEYTTFVKGAVEVHSVKYGRVRSRRNTDVSVVYEETDGEVLHYGTVQGLYSVELDNNAGDARIRIKLADITFFHKIGGARPDGVFFDKIDQTRPYSRVQAKDHFVELACIQAKVVFMSDTKDGKVTFVGSVVKN